MQEKHLNILRDVKSKLKETDFKFNYNECENYVEFSLQNEEDDYAITIEGKDLDRWNLYDDIFGNDTVKQISRYITNRWAAKYFEPKDNSQEEVYLTAGDLKKFIKNVPDKTPVYYERIHDFYFEENGWSFEDQQKQGTQLTIKTKQPQHGSTSEHVRAFSVSCMDGKMLITAHY